MINHLHHVHIFASNLDASVGFYEKFFGGQVALDMEIAGSRNVFMKIGSGRIHLYDQPPKGPLSGPIHHLGIQTDDLEGLVARMKAAGVKFRKPIKDFGLWRYVMAPAPDGVLLELFEVRTDQVAPEIRDYFS